MERMFEIPDYARYMMTYPSGKVYSKRFKRFLKPVVNSRGYYSFHIKRDDDKMKNRPLHQLVAFMFIANPENKPCVNHIDGNKLNNSLDNLEWCTHAENTRHALDTGLHDPWSPVTQYSKKGKFIRWYPSMQQAAEESGATDTCISGCCSGVYNTAGGYVWRYRRDDESDKDIEVGVLNKGAKKVAQYTKEGELVTVYDCIADAARELDCAVQNIGRCCSVPQFSIGGYHWRYVDHEAEAAILPVQNENKKKVVQYSNGREVARYGSIIEASRSVGINRVGISHCLTGRQQTTQGFTWEYV